MPSPAPPLADLQCWLRWVFTDPAGPSAALTGKADGARGPEPRPRLINWISGGTASAEERLAVYSNAYFSRLLEMLESTFPATRRILGETGFRRLAADYLREHPSSSPLIEAAGEHFPGFVAGHEVCATHPFLPDLARLEWEILMALLTPRLPPLPQEKLASAGPQDWERARLTFDPTVRLLKSDWAVDTLWHARNKPENSSPQRLRRRQIQRLLIYRDESWVEMRILSEAEMQTVERLIAGTALSDACAALRGAEASEVQGWFAAWTAAGIVKKISF